MRHIITFVIFSFAAFHAFATVCTQYRLEGSGTAAGYVTQFSTDSAANCASAQAEILRQADMQGYPANRSVSVDSCQPNAAVFTLTFQNPGYSAGSTTFNWGSVQRTGDFCVPDKCEVERAKTIQTNFTVGWVKDPYAANVDSVANMVGDYIGPKFNTYQCVAGCKRYIDSSDGQGFISLEAGPNGLYRMSMDITTIGQGTTCSVPPNSPGDPNAPSPPCPGTIGQVNGKNVCLPKPGPNSSPLPAPTNPASAPSPGVPITPGNPSAGDKPATGPGAGSGGGGRTPPTGNGGNDGGSSSSVGSGSSGGGGTTGGPNPAPSTDKPKDPCGLPGSAACKIDESGTGTGKGDLDGELGKFDQANAGHQTAIGKSGKSVEGLSWEWGFTLPQGQCTPFSWGKGAAFKVDPCSSPWIAVFRNLMMYLFYGLASFYIWRSITASTPGAK